MRITINFFLSIIMAITLSACATHNTQVVSREGQAQPEESKLCRCSRKVDSKYIIKNKSGLFKEKPTWQPVKVCSDGASVYIYLPAGVNIKPVLYILDDKKNPWTIGYQINKHYYRVDYLFKKALLIYEDQKVELRKK